MENKKSKIIELIRKGKLNSDQIANKVGVSPGTVSAIKAHLTMGTYDGPPDKEEFIEAMDTTFGLERDLQKALCSNIEQLEKGLKIIDNGKEFITKAGRIDIKGQDKQGSIVIIELKAGAVNNDCVTQILSYMGAINEKEHKSTRGTLVAGDFPPRVIYAARAVPNLQLKKYTFRFSFEKINVSFWG